MLDDTFTGCDYAHTYRKYIAGRRLTFLTSFSDTHLGAGRVKLQSLINDLQQPSHLDTTTSALAVLTTVKSSVLVSTAFVHVLAEDELCLRA